MAGRARHAHQYRLPLWKQAASCAIEPLLRRSELWQVEDAVRIPHLRYDIYCEKEVEEPAVAIQNLCNALDLIEQVDPRNFARIRRLIARFFLRRGAGAQFWSLTQTCVIEPGSAVRLDMANLASVIVHEATHAWLIDRGIGFGPAERVERQCIRAQLAFARKLEKLGWGVGAYIEYLLRRLSGPVYSSSAIHQFRLRALEARNAPQWQIWIAKLMRRLPE